MALALARALYIVECTRGKNQHRAVRHIIAGSHGTQPVAIYVHDRFRAVSHSMDADDLFEVSTLRERRISRPAGD